MTLDQALQLAIQHHTAGQLQQAEQIYRQILQQSPNDSEALHLLGVLAQQVGRVDVSIDLISRAIAARPNSPLYHSNLGEAYRKAGMLDRAEAACRRAIELAPNLAPAHANLGTVLTELNQLDAAEASLRRSLELEPDSSVALSSLANIRARRGDLDRAIALGRQAIEIAPADVLAHNNLATAMESKGLLEEAEAEYRKAVELAPGFAEALNNLGSVIRRLGRPDEAMQWWRQAAVAKPEFADAHWNVALGLLAHGDYAQGWPMYEWRFRCAHTRRYFREYPVPHWSGSDLNGRTILLYPEQGFGDVIMFARFIPQLAERGAKVVLHLPTELIDIMNGVDGVDQIVGPDEPLPAFDAHLPLLSLPWVLKTTLENLPANVPYIRVDPQRQSQWAEWIGSHDGLTVGLVYAGRAVPDPKRTCRFAELAPLADAMGVTFISLQLGEAATELADAPAGMKVIDLHEHIKTFADTAAAIANLDLLISIDTAAAHIAGALGKPVWTMIPFAPDFRWLYDRDDSPWYPTMKLFRQTRRDDWSDVITRLRAELVAKAGSFD